MAATASHIGAPSSPNPAVSSTSVAAAAVTVASPTARHMNRFAAQREFAHRQLAALLRVAPSALDARVSRLLAEAAQLRSPVAEALEV